ncbi:CYTH domain-containing protein [Nocardiopsis dassonvillei]|uniref:class IV adenylate cyclase n=1 Tax=Nocardiopsis dassonvillei TaxID=2014 RepID=UPI00200CB7DA|nr:CYTH domain-containing protein [Nocardiopsis dassonvillei]MCK9871874.1 CYTH domain-containing protein [Nocardiopsis dassonvillei]
MTPEFEARFLAIDTDAITGRLRERGATCTMPRTLMRRVVLKNQDISDRGGWLRLREQGDRTMLTYKQVNDADGASGIDGILEAEVEVADFHAAQHLLEAMGFAALRYQENYREEWQLDGVTYDLDTWPDLPTYLEIEGPGEEAVRAAAAMLDLDYATATFGSVDEVYLKVLDRDILAESRLVFTSPTPSAESALSAD